MPAKRKSHQKTSKKGSGRIRPKKVTVDISSLIPIPRLDPTQYSGGSYYRRRGGNIWDDMKRGFENFGQQTKSAFEKVGNEFTNKDSVLNRGVADVANKVGNEFTNDKSLTRQAFYQDGFIRNGLIDGLGKAAAATAFIPVIGETVAPALAGIASAAKAADSAARMVGVGMRGTGRQRKYFRVPVHMIRPPLFLDHTIPNSRAYKKKRGIRASPRKRSSKK